MELFQASNQWATRPADERFPTVEAAYEATISYYRTAQTARVLHSDLRVEANRTDLRLVSQKTGVYADLSNWAFSQLVQTIPKARSEYLRTLPPTLAAQNLNYGLKTGTWEESRMLMHSRNGQGMLVRAFNGLGYTRFWNYEVFERLGDLAACWKVPPAMGDKPSGIYASDRDMFCFMVDEENRIDDGTDGGLGRGFFLWNSEVGDKSLGGMTFLFRYICGNHIVWGAESVLEWAMRHTKTVRERANVAFGTLNSRLTEVRNESPTRIEDRIRDAKAIEIGPDKVSVIDALFSKGIASKNNADNAYATVESHPEDGSPRSPWGIMQGLTRLSRDQAYAGSRVELDKSAAAVMEFVDW